MSENTPIIHTEPPDFYLELLLSFADQGIDVPITINVGGFLISGDLISENEYVQKFMRGRFVEKLKSVVTQYESLKVAIEEARRQPSVREKTYTHLHLKNAAFFHPGQYPIKGLDEGSSLWRGLVTSVDGYMFGKLETRTESP